MSSSEQSKSKFHVDLPSACEVEFVKRLREIVKLAGAEYCGIQTAIMAGEDLLMFTNTNTDSTLAVKFNPLLETDTNALTAAIRKRLAENDRDFADRKITVKASVLEMWLTNMYVLSGELERILGRKK